MKPKSMIFVSLRFDAVGHRLESKVKKIPWGREVPRMSAKFLVFQDSESHVWLDNFSNSKKIKHIII